MPVGDDPADADVVRRFLGVVTRTQGTRLRCLGGALTCLASQSVREFEVLVMCHRVADTSESEVHRIVGALPGWLESRGPDRADERREREVS